MAQFRKVRPGAPLHLRAEDWNAAMDAAQAHRAGPRAAPTPRTGVRANPNIVLVRNETGSDQDRFAVLGIDAPIVGPTDNEHQFTSRVGLDGVTPEEGTHEGRFVILAEPIADGKIGRAWISGTAVVKVDVQYETDGYADILDGDTTALVSRTQGSARILWKAAGTGEQWAVVRLGGGGVGYTDSDGTSPFWAVVLDGTLIGESTTWKGHSDPYRGYACWIDELNPATGAPYAANSRTRAADGSYIETELFTGGIERSDWDLWTPYAPGSIVRCYNYRWISSLSCGRAWAETPNFRAWPGEIIEGGDISIVELEDGSGSASGVHVKATVPGYSLDADHGWYPQPVAGQRVFVQPAEALAADTTWIDLTPRIPIHTDDPGGLPWYQEANTVHVDTDEGTYGGLWAADSDR